jgi:hypothetical protein
LSRARWGSPFGGYLYDIGAEVGQDGAGCGNEGPVGDLDDAHSTQRASHDVPDLLFLRDGYTLLACLGFDQSGAAGHMLQPVVVGVVTQVRGDREDVEVAGQVFRPIVDEDRAAVLER